MSLMAFDLAAHIRRTREELGWSQTELAKRAQIDQADLSRIESGGTDPRWSTVNRISTALGEAIVVERPTTLRRSLSPESRAEVRSRGRKGKLDLSALPNGPLPVKR